MDEEKSGESKMYTEEELEKKKKEYSQDQKMDFMMDAINNNAKDIKDIKDTLHNGWDRQMWYNSLVRKGALWISVGIAATIGYLFTIV